MPTSLSTMIQRTLALHGLAARLARHTSHLTQPKPFRNGIYLFFEDGEIIPGHEPFLRRVVRVGTHTGDDRLWRRLRLHYAGNRRVSVFRRRLADSLIARDGAAAHPNIEASVAALLAERFSFACFPVTERTERLELDSALIALLARHRLAAPSDDWLGHWSPSETVRRAGLWNTLETDAEPLSAVQLRRIEDLAMPHLAVSTWLAGDRPGGSRH